MKAVVHNQKYNSPLGLYSTENVTETLITQAKVLTNGGPVSVVYPKMSGGVPGTKSSNVYRMVQNDEDEGYSQSSPGGSPTYMNRRQPQAPAPPPKPMSGGGPMPGPGNWTSGQQQQQQRQHQQPPPPPPPQQSGNYYRPPPQQGQPQRVAVAAGPGPQHSGPQTPPYSPVQQPQYLSEQERYLQEQARLQQKPKYQPQYLPQQQQQQQPQQQQQQPRQVAYNSVAPGSTSTFKSIIPLESHQTNAYGAGSAPQWSPTTGRKSVWPPPKSQEALLTSSQSIKWTGGSPAKKFIWPPPKGHVQVLEEVDERGNVRNVYREVPDSQRAKTYVSPRAPVRLADDAWEPYSGRSDQNGHYQLGSGPGRRLRRFNDIFTPNSTRLPPTYRAPPGTQHVEYE